MKEKVVALLKDSLGNFDIHMDNEEIFSLIEIPKNHSNGDFAFPCYSLSKKLKKFSHEIALLIREIIDDTFPILKIFKLMEHT
jgi:arginyl-tRNA synthetase